MSIPDPWTAPPRPDLVFLRHRRRATAAPATPEQVASAPRRAESAPAVGDPLDLGGDPLDLAGGSLDLGGPPAPAGDLLDLGGPPAPVGDPLDLEIPAAPAPAPALTVDAGALLDLSGSAEPAATPAPTTPPASFRTRPVRRLVGADREILTSTDPTLTLTRLQSGIGALTIEAVVAEVVPGQRLACAYTLRDGASSTVDPSAGRTSAPPGDREPVIVGADSGFGSFRVNLRRSRDLDRLIVFGFSESMAVTSWSGSLRVMTHGGGQVEIPMAQAAPGPATVLLSLYNVDGEFVLRAEAQPVGGGPDEACRAYGFDTITWLDHRTPVT